MFLCVFVGYSDIFREQFRVIAWLHFVIISCFVGGDKNVVYKAEVTSTDNNTTQAYIGVTVNDFKTRYRNHLKSLRNEKYKHETELSKHVWNLKKENRQFSIRWAIVKQTPAGRNGKRNCALCLEEKLMIMKGRSKNILNRRSEIFTNCRHVI